MTIYILPFANKLSSSYTKKVSFTNKSCKANNQYVRKIGVGVDNSQTTYDVKYIGLTEVELLEVETLFSVQALGDLVSFKSPIDAAIGYYFKPTAWRKSRYYKILANNTRVKVYDMEFTLIEGNRLANVLIPIDPVPTYLVNVATTDVYEPYTLACTVTTSGVPDGTILYWTIHNITTDSSDVIPQSGAIGIVSSSASFFIGIVADALIEGVETFQVQLRIDGITGGVVAVSPVVSVRSEIVAKPYSPIFQLLPPSLTLSPRSISPDLSSNITTTATEFVTTLSTSLLYEDLFGISPFYGIYLKTVLTLDSLPTGDAYIIMLQGNFGLGMNSTGLLLNVWGGGGQIVSFTWATGVEYTITLSNHAGQLIITINGNTYTYASAFITANAPNGYWIASYYSGNSIAAHIKEVSLYSWDS